MLSRIRNRCNTLRSSIRTLWLRAIGVEIGKQCFIESGVDIILGFSNGQRGRVIINSRAHISRGVIFNCWGGSITLADNVFLGPYVVIYGHGGVKIGKDTLVSMHCRILSSNHTVPPREGRIRQEPDITLPSVIGDDVWIGAGATILGGVTIGDGCVIGAGAVVTKSLPPYSIALGVPAKKVGERQ
jgi:acetyltransferase-like isoleucine patch superfamily enzyme